MTGYISPCSSLAPPLVMVKFCAGSVKYVEQLELFQQIFVPSCKILCASRSAEERVTQSRVTSDMSQCVNLTQGLHATFASCP